MNIYKAERIIYKSVIRPFLFKIDSELIHNIFLYIGERLEIFGKILELLFSYKDKKLKGSYLGLDFGNPIGLAAGFDYDGHLAKVMGHVGFGFNTVGTVTAKPYEGNKKPRLERLVESGSILVNKGFKSEGAVRVAKRLDAKNLEGHNVGISVGSSNITSVNTVKRSIDDYIFTFRVFKDKKYLKYFELNISCPNTAMTESFSELKNFKKLLEQVNKLHINKPIFIKMPNEISLKDAEKLVEVGMKNGFKGYIFSNLVKDRNNKWFVKKEIESVDGLKGNFSGKPCFENSNKLLKHIRGRFGKNVVLIGAGGVFNYSDAKEMFENGADLIQIITGMIFEGPQIAAEINYQISKDR